MTNKKPRKFYLPCAVVIILFMAAGCTKHYAGNVTATGTAASSSVTSAPALTNYLIGSWVVSKIEIPEMAAKMSSFTNEADRMQMNSKMDIYRNALAGLSTTLNKDGTFESSVGGKTDKGTWVAKTKDQIEVTSQVNGMVYQYQVVHVNSTELAVKYNAGDALLLLTFNRK
jgi:hypothetical protein